MNGPRVGNWVNLEMLEKYIDYQYFLWKDLQLKGENDGRNFHALSYGEVILAYAWFNLNFRLNKTDCSLLNIHCKTIKGKKYIPRKIRRCILIIILTIVCLLIFKYLSRYYDKVIKERGNVFVIQNIDPKLGTCDYFQLCVHSTNEAGLCPTWAGSSHSNHHPIP